MNVCKISISFLRSKPRWCYKWKTLFRFATDHWYFNVIKASFLVQGHMQLSSFRLLLIAVIVLRPDMVVQRVSDEKCVQQKFKCQLDGFGKKHDLRTLLVIKVCMCSLNECIREHWE